MERKFNQQKFHNGQCPHCGNEDISEVTGWCYNHNCPQTFESDLVFCSDHEGGELIVEVKNAWYCWNCDSLFDDKKIVSFNDYNKWGCPVGEEQNPNGEEESAEDYTKRLYAYITEYSEPKIDECVEKGYFLEAIGTLQIQVSCQLKFLLIKKIKGQNNIPLDYGDERFKAVLKWIKSLKDYELFRIAYIFQRISKKEFGLLTDFNTIRNHFVHSFQRRATHNEGKIKSSIENIKKIEKSLKRTITEIGGQDINVDGD